MANGNPFNWFGLSRANAGNGDEVSRQVPVDPKKDGSGAGAGFGATLAVGAAFLLYGATAPLSVPATVVIAGVGALGAAGATYAANDKRVEKNAALETEAGALANQRGSVERLIKKGQGKPAQSREEYFDKLEELFPGESKQIRAARKEAASTEGGEGSDQSGGDAQSGGESGAATDGDAPGSSSMEGTGAEDGASIEGDKVDAGAGSIEKDGE